MAKFVSVGDIIDTEKDFKNFRSLIEENKILNTFIKIFPDLKKIAKPVKIEKKILYLRVDNSIWRSELHIRQQIFIDKLNEYYKRSIIKAIKFVS